MMVVSVTLYNVFLIRESQHNVRFSNISTMVQSYLRHGPTQVPHSPTFFFAVV